MTVIFDLDQTLIDSQIISDLRRQRQWSAIYPRIPELTPYNGISELLQVLYQRGTRIGIVTSSPRPYCERIIAHCGWRVDVTICYHDTHHHKPHPEPLLTCLTRFDIEASQAVAVGDDPLDIQAARSAGIKSIGAFWGALNPQALFSSHPDISCLTVNEITQILTNS